MVLDPTDYDTWSTGSFFTNSIVSAEVANTLPDESLRLPIPCPSWLECNSLIECTGMFRLGA